MLTRLLLLTLLLLPLSPAAAAAAANVLLLHGETGPTPWTDGLAAGAAEETGNSAGVTHEYLGGFSRDADAVDAFARKLKKRLANPVRMVIATDNVAGAFAAKYREELFPGAGVVLAGPDQSDPGRLALCGDCVALPVEADLDRTLDVIFALRPETRLVAGIADGSPSGRAARLALEQAMQRYGDRATTIFPGHEPGDDKGLDPDALAGVLAGMPGNAVAVLLRFQEDSAGNPVSAKQLYRILEARITSPVFVLTDAMLGSGVVGGVLVTGRETGREAVRLAQRILAGEPVREMLPEPVPASAVFDGTALARFGMTPVPGATVVNPPDAPDDFDGIVPGFAPMAVAGLLAFAAALFLLRRYRQNI